MTDEQASDQSNSLLLTTLVGVCFPLAGDDFAKHYNTIAVHEGNAGQTFAVLEGVADQRLLRLKAALGHFVGLQGVRIFHLLSSSFLAHLPAQLGDAASRASATHKSNRCPC